MTSQCVMANIEVFQRQRAQSRKRCDFVVAHIKLFDTCKIFKLAEPCEWVEGQHKDFNIFKCSDERQIFNFKVWKVCILKDRWIFNVKLFDIKIILSFKEQVLVEIIVKGTSAEAIFKVIDKHYFDWSQVETIKLICLNLKVWVIFLIDTLELVCADILNKLIVYIVDFLEEGRYVLGADELIIVGLEQCDCVSKVSNLILIGIVQNIVIFHQVFGNNQIVVHHEPHLLSSLVLQTTLYRIMPFRKINLSLPEQFTWRDWGIEKWSGRVNFLFNHKNLTDQNRSWR